jgi:hypothetical protein
MSQMPLFVKVEEYKDILDVINMVRSKLDAAKKTLGKINDLKNEEDAELELWHTTLDEVEHKIDFVDKTLFEPEAL